MVTKIGGKMVELSFNSETTISGSLKFDFRQLRWFSIGKYTNGDFWTKTMLERPSRLRIATCQATIASGSDSGQASASAVPR